MSLVHHFDTLMHHLGSREDSLAEMFRDILVDYCREADDDAHWRQAFEDAGVDNWSGFSDAMEIYSEEP